MLIFILFLGGRGNEIVGIEILNIFKKQKYFSLNILLIIILIIILLYFMRVNSV